MSDNDASDTGGDQNQDKVPKRPSRPVTAAARRERRASARPAGDAKPAANKSGPARAGRAGDRDAGKVAKDRATPKRDRTDKKAPLFSRLVRFIREVWAELRKVIWPNRKQMITYTAVVLAFVIFMVALVSGLDLVFGRVVSVVFGA